MKTLSFIFVAAITATTSAEACKKYVIGLNEFCDPVDTMYAGGTPLFNEATGQTSTREEYLARKGLNIYCDPIDTMYAGGNPLFNSSTGRMMSLETYLKSKYKCIKK